MSTGNLNTVVNTARIALEPLDAHYIAQKGAAFKNDYLTLLAAFLLEEGILSQEQQRMLLLLLSAITPPFQLSHYLQQAAKLDAAELQRIIDNLRHDQRASQALLFDFVVVQRIAGPLTQTNTERLTWVAKLTELNEKQCLHIKFWSMFLLGIEIDFSQFMQLKRKVKISEFESVQWFDSSEKAKKVSKKLPCQGDFLPKGEYVYIREGGQRLSKYMLLPEHVIRAVNVIQHGVVFNVIMDKEKNINPEYGKNGEPIFDMIFLPTAFNAWKSFFVGGDNE